MSISSVSSASLEFVQLRLIVVGTQVTVALGGGDAVAAVAVAAATQSQPVSDAPAVTSTPPEHLDNFA
jgi:hypothetical protein